MRINGFNCDVCETLCDGGASNGRTDFLAGWYKLKPPTEDEKHFCTPMCS